LEFQEKSVRHVRKYGRTIPSAALCHRDQIVRFASFSGQGIKRWDAEYEDEEDFLKIRFCELRYRAP